MILLEHLTHKATVTKKTPSDKDEYGTVSYITETVEVPCFFDMPTEEIKISGQGDRTFIAQGILFVQPTASIKVNDLVSKIVDRGGNIIKEDDYRVGEIDPATDDEGVHHLEVYLINNK